MKDGQKTTSNRLRKIRHSFRFIFGLSRFGKARTTLNILARTIYIPPFAKCAKDGAPDHSWLSQGWAARLRIRDDGLPYSIISFYGRPRTNTRQGRIHPRHSIPDSIPVVREVKCCLWRQLRLRPYRIHRPYPHLRP